MVHEVARVGHDLVTKPPPPWLIYDDIMLFSDVEYSDSVFLYIMPH